MEINDPRTNLSITRGDHVMEDIGSQYSHVDNTSDRSPQLQAQELPLDPPYILIKCHYLLKTHYTPGEVLSTLRIPIA